MKIADTITTHVWEGANIVLDISDSTVNTYLRGVNLIKDKSGYFLFNAHGDVVQHGSKGYKYDAFGNELATNANDVNPFRYAGEYFDGETGTYYLRARYYDPSNGRFSSEDPIKNGLNWYTYCIGNPLAFIDPLGLSEVALREYAERHGATVTWHESLKSAKVSYGNKYMWVYSTSSNNRGGRLYIDDSILNNMFGWGDPVIALGSIITNAPNRKMIPLKNGWSYRYDVANTDQEQSHMHLLYKNSEDYSQNDDGTNHHGPKGGSGPPKSIQKMLRDKTGWDWEGNAKSNADRAVTWYSQESRVFVIQYADGSYYRIYDQFYVLGPNYSVSDEAIMEYYYSASYSSTGTNVSPVIVPIPYSGPLPTIGDVPILIFGY